MRAVRFHTKRDVRVEDVPGPPADPADDEVLVAPELCGICGTDLHEFVAGPIVTPVTPNALTGATLPQILGHEFSARVLKVGRGVAHVAEGDLVSIQPLIAGAKDPYARRGLTHLADPLGVIGLSHAWGGLGERAMLKGANVVRVPPSMSAAQAALIEPAAVAIYSVDRARVQSGAAVLVAGAGPIGTLALLAARAAGATTIIIAEPNPLRREKAASVLPGVVALDPGDARFVDTVRALTEDGLGVDAALECVGHESALNSCVEAVRRQGIVVQAGLHTRRASVDPMLWALKDITIEAVWCYPVTIWPRIIRMIDAGLLPVERVVTGEIDADDIVADGFEALLKPDATQLKILVRA